jgi:hypothetical protein
MRKIILSATVLLALALTAPAFANSGHSSGHATYYKIQGGSLSFNIGANSTLNNKYGIDLGSTVGPFSLKKGGSVYQSSNTLTADVKKSQSFTLKYDTRGPNGHKGGVTTLTIKRLSLTIGKSKSFLIGNVSGSSTVPGVSVAGGEYKIFNIDGGKVKKAKSSKYKYTFASGKVAFNSQVTSLLNSFGTPKGTDKASAKINLGSISVKIK